VADGPVSTFENTLGVFGLLELFDARTISETVGVDKPHPRMFQAALSALGIEPVDYGRVVMMGNNLERDIRGANALGLISVWIDWAPRRSKIPASELERPRHTIHEPLELLDLLSKIG
jgi:putative hydrolase of the HAD superfamily